MNEFAKLLDPLPDELPGDTQRRARGELRRHLAEGLGGLRLRDPERPIPTQGRSLVLGVASYSLHDLKLLDRLVASLRERETDAAIETFDVLDCENASDVARYLPGVNGLRMSPALAMYIDGELISSATSVADVTGALRQFVALKDAA